MKDRRRRNFWEDFDESQQKFMLYSAVKADAIQQARLDDFRRSVTDYGSSGTTFHSYRFEKPEAWDVMNRHEQRAYLKQARRDWKRSRVTRTTTYKIGGGVDVNVSRRRSPFERGGIESGVSGTVRTKIASFQPDGKGGLVQTFDYFKDRPHPEDVAGVFGIPFESAFKNLPPRRPQGQQAGNAVPQQLKPPWPKPPKPEDEEDK